MAHEEGALALAAHFTSCVIVELGVQPVSPWIQRQASRLLPRAVVLVACEHRAVPRVLRLEEVSHVIQGEARTDAAAGEASMSYSIGGAAGGVSYGLVGTDSNDDNVSAFEWNVAYDMSGMSLTFASDNVDGADAVNTLGVTAPLGALSVTVSADDNEDWNASASYSAGGLSVNYATDEESAWEANASYALGGGATAFVASNSTEFSVGGVEFTF